MGAYVWLKGAFGLWTTWLLVSVLNLFKGFFWNTIIYVRDVINATPIGFPKTIADAMDFVNNAFTSVWNWIGLIIFGAWILYMYINSLRREPYEVITG